MEISIQDEADPGTVILDRDAIDQLTRGKIIDAPITRLKSNPDIWVLPTAMQQNGDIFLSHTLIRGDLEDLENAEYCIINEHALFEIPERLEGRNNGRHWITNLLHLEEGVLAFLHSEYTAEDDYFGMPAAIIDRKEARAPGRSCISLAWLSAENLENERFRFDFLGHLSTYCAEFPHHNVSGTPVFVNEQDGVEYLNIMFTDIKGHRVDGGWVRDEGYVSQARAPLADVIDQAQKGNVIRWHKRDGSEWKEAMGRQSSGVLPHIDGFDDDRISSGEVIVHSDVVRHGGTGRFILLTYVLTQKGRNPTCLVLYSSADGLRWEFEGTSHARSDCEKGWSYATFFDESAVGEAQDLSVIIGWEYGKDARCVYKLGVEIKDT